MIRLLLFTLFLLSFLLHIYWITVRLTVILFEISNPFPSESTATNYFIKLINQIFNNWLYFCFYFIFKFNPSDEMLKLIYKWTPCILPTLYIQSFLNKTLSLNLLSLFFFAESNRMQFFRSVAQALLDFNELTPIAPLQLLLEVS